AYPRAWSRPLASERGSPVSLGDVLQRLDVQLLLRHQLLQPAVLFFQLLQSNRFGGLHPAVLVLPPQVARLADLERLQHRSQVLPGAEHRVRITQLPHDLFRTVSLTTLRTHARSPCPSGRLRPSQRAEPGV